MAELKAEARELSRALDKVNEAVDAYFAAALAVGRSAPDGPTARGLDPKQIRRKLQCFIIAQLSPKTNLQRPLLAFDGAPEARRYIEAHPLPGLA